MRNGMNYINVSGHRSRGFSYVSVFSLVKVGVFEQVSVFLHFLGNVCISHIVRDKIGCEILHKKQTSYKDGESVMGDKVVFVFHTMEKSGNFILQMRLALCTGI